MSSHYPDRTRHQEFWETVEISKSCGGSLEFFPLNFFPNLSIVDIKVQESLEPLTTSNEPCQDLMSLSYMGISGCSKFISFPRGGLHASNLTHLLIHSCEMLKKFPEKMHNLLPSLHYLGIFNCPELESFPEGDQPSSLGKLRLQKCSKLVTNRMNWNLQTLKVLTHFTIGDESERGWNHFQRKVCYQAILQLLLLMEFQVLKAWT